MIRKFLLFCFLINLYTALKTSDLCQLNSTMIYHNKCMKPYNYRCDKHYCTIGKEACSDFHSLKTHVHISDINRKEIKEIIKLIKTIKFCHKYDYKWDPADVCINVYYATRSSKRIGGGVGDVNSGGQEQNKNRLMIFSCNGKYSFKCSDYNYCAVKNEACNEIKYNINDSRIKKCGNINIVF